MTSNENFRTNVHNVPLLQTLNPSKGLSNPALWLQGWPDCSWKLVIQTGMSLVLLRSCCELGYKQGLIGNFGSQRKAEKFGSKNGTD